MTNYIILFIAGIIWQICAVAGILFTQRVEKHTHSTEKTVRVIDYKTGEMIFETDKTFDETKWKIIPR